MNNDKVAWKDGLFVQPQHFQQSERYLVSILHQSLHAYVPYLYGFISYEIDLDALKGGSLILTSASGILPDGTPFSISQGEELPGPRSINEIFDHQSTSQLAYLALPLVQEGRPALSDDNNTGYTRFRSAICSVTDETFGKTSEEIEVCKKTFHIRFENEDRDNFTTLPLVKLKRTSNEDIIIDETFIPPMLRISASLPYLRILQSILSILHTKASELLEGRKQTNTGIAEFASGDITMFGILNSITTFTPLLTQYLNSSSRTHPHDIHKTLTMLCGSLSAFMPGREIQNLPFYDHDDPVLAIVGQQKIIKDILNADYAPRCAVLKVTPTGKATYLCSIEDESLLDTGDFYLGISADTSQEELSTIVKRTIKISSRDQLPRLTISASNGLQFNQVLNPPAELASKPGYVYFNFVKQGLHWQQICASCAIALYFPNNFSGLSIEMLVIKSPSGKAV
jgi:type VI secretion system protein ImpJ